MNRGEMLTYEHKFKSYRKLMSKEKMAAQFLPFAALTGFDQIILDNAKERVMAKILSEDRKEEINMMIKRLKYKDNVKITFFKQEDKRLDGNYITTNAIFEKIDEVNKTLIFNKGLIIKFKDLYKIEILEN